MKQTRIILFCCSLILWLGAVYTEPIVQASEGAGGQVSTTGKISFYEEKTEVSSSSTTKTSEVMPPKTSEKSFPNTGEQIRKYSLFGGVLLLLALLLLFLRKHREGEQK
jgi:LPXTG-motif cell wall-anchored protein